MNKSISDDIKRYKHEKHITGFSLLQITIMYCEEYELDLEEVGEAIKKDKNFRNVLESDLKFNHEAVFENDNNRIAEWLGI